MPSTKQQGSSPEKASCQEILKESLTDLEIKDSPFLQSYRRGLHPFCYKETDTCFPLAKVNAFDSWVSTS